MRYSTIVFVLSALLFGASIASGSSGGHHTAHRQWYFFDPESDSISGISLIKAHDMVQDRPAKEVVVAVIDTGFDIDHPHLKNNLWTNPGEVAANGIDDDNNGYADDIHGWNFLGGPEGNILIDNLEVTREYARLLPRYGTGRNTSGREYDHWIEVQREFLKSRNAYEKKYNTYADLLADFQENFESISPFLTGDALSIEILQEVEFADEGLAEHRDSLIKYLSFFEKHYAEKNDAGETVPYTADDFTAEINNTLDGLRLWTEYFYNPDYNPREKSDENDSRSGNLYYGNNEVWEYGGPYGYHGTHVAGIIAGYSQPDDVVHGVAEHVKLMLLRACSTGDERDKDIAGAIRYAADNGAQIINMSFGKFYSPQRKIVNKAIRHAARKGVLMVHAAGNEYTNTDIRTVFPEPPQGRGRAAKYWISVGATDDRLDKNLVASFSNYGKETVDIFAPGMKIYSAMPGNAYKMANGTSMAAPVVAGVAALLLSYHPELSASEVKEIMMRSAFRPEALEVYQPGSNYLIDFGELSNSGGIVNAYRALQLAEKAVQ